jgi:uracil-DNA glycosylase
LLNIFKEVKNDCGETPNSTTLVGWAEQGVLLLNTVLTVRNGLPNSHKDSGWVIFTDQIIQALNEREERVIFMLWGNPARGKRGWIKDSKHIVLESAHPSPLAAHKGFFGCKHFSKANNFLEEKINWTNSRSLKNA